MTTVAYKEGILAFDSKISDGDRHSGWVTKGIKTKKFIVAGCGAVEDLQAFLDWMRDGGVYDDRKKYGLDREVDIAALAIDKKGTVYHYGGRLYPFQVSSQFHATGSGADFAIGAMAFGASAIQAVSIAGKFDCYTGGSIKHLKW